LFYSARASRLDVFVERRKWNMIHNSAPPMPIIARIGAKQLFSEAQSEPSSFAGAGKFERNAHDCR